MMDWSIWLGVGAGGALGALGRGACLKAAAFANLDAQDAGSRSNAAFGLLIANTVGCFGMGVLASEGIHLPNWLFLMLTVGFCGSLTTFSTLCAELVRRLRMNQGIPGAALYLGISLSFGYVALSIGLRVGA